MNALILTSGHKENIAYLGDNLSHFYTGGPWGRGKKSPASMMSNLFQEMTRTEKRKKQQAKKKTHQKMLS